MPFPALRTILMILAFAATHAVAASPGVPDSLLPPKWSWRNATLEGNPTAIGTGKILMAGGALATLTGVLWFTTDLLSAGLEEASANGECFNSRDSAACAYKPRELSPVPPVLVVAGLGSLATGIIIALIARDDSGRDKRYYAFVAPGLVGGGIRRRF